MSNIPTMVVIRSANTRAYRVDLVTKALEAPSFRISRKLLRAFRTLVLSRSDEGCQWPGEDAIQEELNDRLGRETVARKVPAARGLVEEIDREPFVSLPRGESGRFRGVRRLLSSIVVDENRDRGFLHNAPKRFNPIRTHL